MIAEMHQAVDWFAAIKDLGGWAVVVGIVWWMLRRGERVMDDHTQAIIKLAKEIDEHHRAEEMNLDKLVEQNKEQTKLLETLVINGGHR